MTATPPGLVSAFRFIPGPAVLLAAGSHTLMLYMQNVVTHFLACFSISEKKSLPEHGFGWGDITLHNTETLLIKHFTTRDICEYFVLFSTLFASVSHLLCAVLVCVAGSGVPALGPHAEDRPPPDYPGQVWPASTVTNPSPANPSLLI